jgi:hypothetical protein
MVNDVTGVLLEKEDLPRLGDIVADLLLDDARRERLARGALEFARKNIWTWDERVRAEMVEMEQLVLKNRGRRGLAKQASLPVHAAQDRP